MCIRDSSPFGRYGVRREIPHRTLVILSVRLLLIYQKESPFQLFAQVVPEHGRILDFELSVVEGSLLVRFPTRDSEQAGSGANHHLEFIFKKFPAHHKPKLLFPNFAQFSVNFPFTVARIDYSRFVLLAAQLLCSLLHWNELREKRPSGCNYVLELFRREPKVLTPHPSALEVPMKERFAILVLLSIDSLV